MSFPSPLITDLVFFEPYIASTQIIVGKMAVIGTALSAANPTIIPIIYVADLLKFTFTKVFPADTATLATLSTFTVSASAYNINFATIEIPRVAYSESSKTYTFTFFAYNSANNQYLFTYKLKPRAPHWEVVDAAIYIPQNSP